MAGKEKKGIYLDYAASTPVSEAALRAMKPYLSGGFGNTESVHSFGREAEKAVSEAREAVAKALGLPPASGFREIVFTASATEANNLALRGVVGSLGSSTSLGKLNFREANIVISSIEHSSVYETARALEKEGVEIRLARPDKRGVVSPEAVRKLLDGNTLLVSVMQGNNETGAIQPITAIGKAIAEFKVKSPKSKILFHTDAAQSFMYLALRPHECGVDLATLSSHKMHGPKGAAALFVRDGLSAQAGVKIAPQITGGAQERGLRAGTLNVSAIAGFGAAIAEAEKKRAGRAKKVSALRKYFWEALRKNIKSVGVNGDMKNSLPHIFNLHFQII